MSSLLAKQRVPLVPHSHVPPPFKTLFGLLTGHLCTRRHCLRRASFSAVLRGRKKVCSSGGLASDGSGVRNAGTCHPRQCSSSDCRGTQLIRRGNDGSMLLTSATLSGGGCHSLLCLHFCQSHPETPAPLDWLDSICGLELARPSIFNGRKFRRQLLQS